MIRTAATILGLLWAAQDPGTVEKISKERTTLLRTALKTHAAFAGFDPARGEVRLHVEGEKDERTWPIDADAEVRIHGVWGGLEDLVKGERVWVWVRPDREKKPRAIFMIADEISEQEIHRVPYRIVTTDPLVIGRKLDGKTEQSRTLKPAAGVAVQAKPGDTVYVQTAGGDLVRIVDADGLAALKAEQRERLAARWRKDGLPGSVATVHIPTGEIEVVLDHEAMRWGRALKPGDAVTLRFADPVKAAVLEMRPWNERTRLTLAVVGRELPELEGIRRVRVAVPEPSAELLATMIPPDAGRPREGAARVDWFLSSTYCNCSIAGDVCTGMFYTLSGCNSMTCGMPKRVRGFVAPLLEKGLSDKEVLGAMEKEFGEGIWRPHLLR